MAVSGTKICRLLDPELIELWEYIDSPVDETTGEIIKPSHWEVTLMVLRRCCEVLERSPLVRNAKRLFEEFEYREKQASTAFGNGIAFPHVRSMNVRGLVLAFLRYPEGAPMETLDGEPAKFVFAMTTPKTEDDTSYQRIFRKIMEMLQDQSLIEELESAQVPGEIIRAFSIRE